MNIYEFIKSRRTIRKFRQDELSVEQLNKYIDAARVAPSAANIQPLKYVVVKSREMSEKMFPLVKWAGSGATLPLTGFGYALAKGTKEAVMKDGLLGALSGPLASSSVGIMAAVISGLIASVFARSKDK